MNPSTPPKGSLEDLFRHHLLESEAAAVPPRPLVWEHLDNRLLLAQNEKYRRRLAAYRWAVAASLLLASLAGGGWWHSQQAAAPTATLAQATPLATSRPGLATARRAATPPASVAQAGTAAGPATIIASAPSTLHSFAIDQTTTLSAPASAEPAPAITYAPQPNRWRTARPIAVDLSEDPRSQGMQLAASDQAATRRAAAELATSQTSEAAGALALTTSNSAGDLHTLPGASSGELAAGQALTNGFAVEANPAGTQALASATPTGEEGLPPRWTSLSAVPPAGLPANLTAVAVAPGPPLELARHWQYGLSYSAGAFRPNIDFSKAPETYSTAAFGLNSPIITRSAAAEYRNNLHTGLGQRLSLWATRRLGASRWSLRTGLELTQSTAASASSVAFVGESVADLAYTQAVYAPARLQRTSYRYRSVNVPVEARYSNPVKVGFSFYGRVGAFVTALLNVHSEVEGNPEAARTYTPASVNSPYRHLSAGLRGGGGLQYRPAGHQWTLNLGPVVEMGVLSLNADPIQNFLTQQRPYSFGLEAGMELGRGFKIQ
jgi:hypothetical protein